MQDLAAGWHPIETAPKDGRLVLVWRKHATSPRITRWDAAFGEWEEEISGDHVYHITHWMPLPEAPELTAMEKLIIGHVETLATPISSHEWNLFWKGWKARAAAQPLLETEAAVKAALVELIDKILPGLDSGDILDDAKAASEHMDKLSEDRK